MLSEKIIKTIHEEFPELQNLVSSGIEAEAQKIRDMIPSGFVELGELDYDYMENNENVVKLKTKSIAYVNGYRVEIPANTVVDIGKAPEKDGREDLLFLEVWKDEDFLKDGQVKWRIRHCEEVDFSLYQNGLECTEWGSAINFNFNVVSQGGNDTCLVADTWNDTGLRLSHYGYYSFDMRSKTGLSGKQVLLDDHGIFIGGMGDSISKQTLKTLDGYSYAIPMFRLYRKPSCGKAIPFEYQKINPKVDYAKFAELMKEERVERVVSENIGGRSLVNLVINRGDSLFVRSGTGTFERQVISDYRCKYILKSGDGFVTLKLCNPNILKSSTKYTVCFNVYKNTFGFTGVSLRIKDDPFFGEYDDNIFLNKNLISHLGFHTIVFETNSSIPTTGSLGLSFPKVNLINGEFEIGDLILLEGDWTNKEIPDFFTGLKSLSENEGNLIEVKTGILNPSSYDPSTGNVKLNTVSEANYITSDNLIIPNIEAQVKRGDSKLSDLTSFGKIDNLVGDEKIEFTKIKGKTLQNLATMSISEDYCGDGYCKFAHLQDYEWVSSGRNTKDSAKLKPATKYTVIFEVVENSITDSSTVIFINVASSTRAFKESPSVSYNFKGVSKKILTTKDQINNGDYALYPSLLNAKSGQTIKFRYAIYEGDYTDTPLDQLPYVDGIKSVGELEDNKVSVKRTGKNLFDEVLQIGSYSSSSVNNRLRATKSLRLTPENHILNADGLQVAVVSTNINNEYNGIKDSGWRNPPFVFNPSEYGEFVGLVFRKSNDSVLSIDDKYNISLFKGSSTMPYEPYSASKQEITLKEPLRSLPNGVCDTIEGNKVIRRVGKLVLNGTESWSDNGTSAGKDYFLAFYKGNFISTSFYCDTLPTKHSNITANETQNILGTSPYKNLYVNLSKNVLSRFDPLGVKQWFAENPTTVYYELAAPIEEIIEPNYDKESVKTYQLDAPLRSLPNGVKDEIVGDRLIRRCGEVILDGSDDEGWGLEIGTYPFISTNKPFFGIKATQSQLVCDKLPVRIDGTDDMISTIKKNIPGIMSTNNIGQLRLRTGDLSTTLENSKMWLKNNPVKVIYELATPIEIPLKEVHSNTANFSLQRQFGDGNWLRELPNGVRDTVENGKVIRRVGVYSVNSNDSWVVTGTTGGKYMELSISNLKPESVLLSNTLQSANIGGTLTSNPVGIMATLTPTIRLKYTVGDCTLDGFKQWLVQNPTTIYYELKTPVEEPLSTDNYMPYPYHEINTYCGGMYIGNGTNDVFVENGLGNDGVIVDTPFRSVENKGVIEDCKYKKNVDGYSNSFMTGSKKNLLNVKDSRYFNTVLTNPPTYGVFISKDEDSAGVITLNSANSVTIGHATNGYKGCKIWVKLLPNTQYCLSFGLSGNTIQMLQNNGTSEIYVTNGNDGVVVLTTDEQGIGNVRIETQSVGFATLNNLQLEIGNVKTSYESFVSTQRFIENTESNDVDDLRHLTSLVGFNYDQILNKSFDSLLRGEL